MISPAFPRAAMLCMLALAFCTLRLSAQTAHAYEGEAWSLLDVPTVMKTAAEITAAKYPDSDDVAVDGKLMRIYHADGTAESQDETFTKVLTEKAKRNNRTITRGFMLPYSTVSVVRLEILHPDGTALPVDVAANSKESIDDSQMQSNIYDPNSKILQVNIPQLEIDDTIHLVVRTTTERPIIPGEYSSQDVFEGGYIRHLSYEIRAPQEKPLKHVFLRDEVPGTVQASQHPGPGNTLVYHWEVKDVRRMFDEPRMPSYNEVLQRLLVSTTPDWPAISKWYWQISQPHLDTVTPDMKKLVGELTAKAQTDQDKIKAVFYYVSKNIRYMGLTPEKDRPGFEPHDVSLTFDKKYGVCRDKAALLVSLLRTAGFESYPVLMSVGEKRDGENPDPGFNHAIVSVVSPKGAYQLMDPTDENTLDLLPSYEGDQSYLVCRPNGEKLMTSAVNPPETNLMRIQTTGRLDATGALEAKSELWFDGINDNAYRAFFAKTKPDDIRRFFEAEAKAALPGAVVKSLTVTPTDMLDTSQPVHAVLEYSAADSTVFGGGKAVVNLPWIGGAFGVLNFMMDGMGLEKRVYPMRMDVACGVQEDFTIKLAEGFTGAVSMPVCTPVDDASVAYQRQFAMQDGVLRGGREFKLKQVSVAPAAYLVLKKTLESMGNDARKSPILSVAEGIANRPRAVALASGPVAVDSDSRLIAMEETLAAKDAHTAKLTVKTVREVLTYNGKKKESEVKIGYNPADQEVHLLHAVVTAKGGARQEIAPGEINVMDAGWVAHAKRYTGGKLLVANLPGVEIGSTIELEFEVVSHDKPYLSAFVPFQQFNALEKKSFRITAPAGLELRELESGPAGVVTVERKQDAAGQVHSWTATQVKALPTEPGLPPNWAYRSGLEYFVGDENAYLRQLQETLLDRAAQATQAKAKARELTAGAKSRADAVIAIRDFVAKSIRVAGPGFAELPLRELSGADTTLADGYGHLMDRAILLQAMLTAAGFKPEFILASELPALDALARTATTFPLPDAFYYPLVRIELEGRPCYLNDTHQYARLGATGFEGKLAIQLASQAHFTITIPAEAHTKTATEFQVALDDTGRTRITQIDRFYGQDFAEKKKFFAELPPEERNRWFQEVVSGVAQGARSVGDLQTKFDDYPGAMQFTVEVDHYSVVDGKYFYLDLPFAPGLFQIESDRRTLPLYLRNTWERTVRTVVELPAKYRNVVIAPKSIALAAPAGAGVAEISTTQSADRFIITHRLKSSPAIVAAADVPAVQSLESALENKASRLLLLRSEEK